MCFSPEASFVASGGLAVLSVASLKIAGRKERLLALVPLFFAVQQFFEGIQWVSLHRGVSSLPAAYAFLFFAFLFWPVYIPLVVYKIDKERRAISRWFIGVGALTAITLLAGMLMHPLTVQIVNKCILYNQAVFAPFLVSIFYIVAVCGSLMFSRDHFLVFMGMAVLVLAGVAEAFYYYAFASVWCFFAAAVSGLIYWHLKDLTGKSQRVL